MGYYQGAGDMEGDPGFWSDLWGGVKTAAKIAAPIVSSVPGWGQVAGAGLTIVGGLGEGGAQSDVATLSGTPPPSGPSWMEAALRGMTAKAGLAPPASRPMTTTEPPPRSGQGGYSAAQYYEEEEEEE